MNQKQLTTTAYYLAFILLGLSVAAEGNTLLKLAEYTSSDLAQISWIFFFSSFGYLFGSYQGGKLFDRMDGHRLLGTALLLTGLFIVFIPLARALWVLIAIQFLLGAVKGAVDVGCNTLLIWLHKEKVNPFMNGLHAFFGVGTTISPLVIAWVLKNTSEIYWVFWIFAILAVPLAVFVFSLPSPQPRAVPEHHQAVAFPIVPVLVMAACFVLYVGMEIGYGNWIYTYAVKRQLADQITANNFTAVFWGFFTLGRLAGIWISTRLRSLTIITLDFAGSIVGIGLILLFPTNVQFIWAGSVILGFSFASIFPTLLALAEERIHITGTITGLFLVGGSLGGMTIPVLIGQAFERLGANSMMWIVFVSTLLNILFLLLFIKLPAPAVTADAKFSGD